MSGRDSPIKRWGSGSWVQLRRRSQRYIDKGRSSAQARPLVGQLDGRLRLSPQGLRGHKASESKRLLPRKQGIHGARQLMRQHEERCGFAMFRFEFRKIFFAGLVVTKEEHPRFGKSPAEMDVALMEAFGRNGYTPAELMRFFAAGGQVLSIMEGGHPVSVGLLYRNFAHIWEIAALFTHPSARRQGYSVCIVRTALHTLQQRGYTPRYVVDDTNTPSIKLAEMVGLQRFLTIIHYTASGRGVMDTAP